DAGGRQDRDGGGPVGAVRRQRLLVHRLGPHRPAADRGDGAGSGRRRGGLHVGAGRGPGAEAVRRQPRRDRRSRPVRPPARPVGPHVAGGDDLPRPGRAAAGVRAVESPLADAAVVWERSQLRTTFASGQVDPIAAWTGWKRSHISAISGDATVFWSTIGSW